MNDRHIGLLGATSMVGACLLQLLPTEGWKVAAFSRNKITGNTAHITWHCLSSPQSLQSHPDIKIALWICVAPIWVLPEYFDLLQSYGIKRIVTLSSTSSITKRDSTDTHEQNIANQLIDGENRLVNWAATHHIEWIILRPTLIYGLGRDKNITEIVRFIQRFRFFPLLGKANGLRQPVHAQDVAKASFFALKALNSKNRTYNLSGGETLTYRDMVKRIFLALNMKPRLITVPLWLFRLTINIMRCLPRFRHLNSVMAERMNRNLVFDNSELQQHLHFQPRSFMLSQDDLP